MNDRSPTEREARVLDAMGSWVYEKPSGFSASEWVELEEQGWIEPQADLPDDHYYYARRTLEGRAALESYRKAQPTTLERMFAAVAPEVQFVDAGRPDIADDVTRYDADLARLVAAVQPFRVWLDEGGVRDAGVGLAWRDQLVALLNAVDEVIAKGELK